VTIRIATALTDAGRESAVVRSISEIDDATVVRRCRDVVELRAVAHSAQVDVVVVDAGLRGLDREVVAGLAAGHVRCVVVGEQPWNDPAVVTVPSDLSGLADALHRRGRPAVRAATPSPASPALGAGRVVVVWGPMGAPGRTTVAIELASALSHLGADVLLADLDTTGPSVAQLLGLLDDTSGVAAAARLGAEGSLTPHELAGLAVSVPAGPRVLVGLPSPERWTELRTAATEAVLGCARATVPWTVVDIGPLLEGDDLTMFDPDLPQRFGAARTALSTADAVVCVGRRDAVGVTRLLKDVPKVISLAPTAAVEVGLNRVRTPRAARQARDLVQDVLQLVPRELADDRDTIEQAQLRGEAVRERAADSPFARSVLTLAEDLTVVLGTYDQLREQTDGTHRRLLRGAHRRHRHRDARVV
jgi:cellulose biosynthesis protein BcsQ